jgi:oligopeptide transport system permease protein
MVLAPILLLILGLKLDWLPVQFVDGQWSSYFLPCFCLSLFFIANIARLTRGSMLEVLSSNYVKTAKSKGLPTWRIVIFHCLKPTLIPVVSYLGPATASMLAGSLVIEKIFVIPGIGRQFVDSAFARDYTMALGMILFYCVMVVSFNALVDISYMFLDPKIRKAA